MVSMIYFSEYQQNRQSKEHTKNCNTLNQSELVSKEGLSEFHCYKYTHSK